MLRYFFLFLLIIHGLIHLLGFVKGFKLAAIEELNLPVSRVAGALWLVAAILFLGTVTLNILGNNLWHWLGVFALILSQILVFSAWQDAKYATLANLFILVPLLAGIAGSRFEQSYEQDVRQYLQKSRPDTVEILTEADIQSLPMPVQEYIRYTGAVGKPRIHHFRVSFEGEMREKGKDWFPFTSEQYNFIEPAARLFFMKASVKGLPAYGYHAYKNETARMLIKLLSLFPVVDLQNEDLFRTETVTYFNDLCLMAPAALIDERIQWEESDSLSAKATFTNNGTSISARLEFNQEGQLVNFFSDDRMEVNASKYFTFSTPVREYREFNGYRLPAYGEAVWHYPEGEFVYGKFDFKAVEYNVKR